MLLELKDIAVYYGKAQALKGISLKVDEGEIVVIIGSNGAGKTTTLKSIAGLVRPAQGEIWLEGRRIDGQPPEKVVREGISICMEGRRLFPFMTVLENLHMGAFRRRDRGGIRSDLESVFGTFPVLEKRQKQKAGTLSGGEQQMVAIARALMSRPRLLLLDEPSLGLAPKVVEDVERTVEALNKTGLTILLVEQNAEMALALAHRGYVLEVGNITVAGDGQALRGNDHVQKFYLGI
jgi:branched-chain amino acid transport system ATP-binding protein